jgi:hypothetical protein
MIVSRLIMLEALFVCTQVANEVREVALARRVGLVRGGTTTLTAKRQRPV